MRYLVFLLIAGILLFTSCGNKGSTYGYKTPPSFTLPQYDASKDTTLLFPVKVDNEYGYINQYGQIVIEPQYENAYDFKDGLAHVFLKGSSFTAAIIDKSNRVIWKTSDTYYDFGEMKDGLCPVSSLTDEGFKTGFINRKGEFVIPLFFSRTWDFENGFCRVCMYDPPIAKGEGLELTDKQKEARERWGFINTKGELVVPFIYNDLDDFSEGLAVVEKNGKKGVIDTTGKIIIPIEYDDIASCKEGLIPASKNDVWGVLNKENQWVIQPEYEVIWSFSEGMAVVKKNGLYGFVNTSGKLVVPCKYDLVFDFREGIADVDKDGKTGGVNKKGELVIPMKFDGILWFQEGLSSAEDTKAHGFIDSTGNWVIPPIYSDARPFDHGLAAVVMNGYYYNHTSETMIGYINRKGEYIWPLTK